MSSASSGPPKIPPATRLTRRGFLHQVVVAASALSLAEKGRAAAPAAAATAVSGPSAAAGAPVTVIALPVSTDANPRAGTWGYLGEILNRAGVFHDSLPAARLEELFQRNRTVAILPGHLPLSTAQRDTLAAWVRAGGSLLGLGGTSGLDEVFGAQGGMPLAEGWIKPASADHPVTAGLRSSLHVFGGYAVKKGTGAGLAEIETGNRAVRGSAMLENRFGSGRALLFGPDLIFSVVHIQQGVAVLQDGRPAPDESASLNDGVLKAEDGMVLDWQRDRQPAAPDGGRIFLEPVSDDLRELILRGVFHLAQQAGIRLPLLWYWPGQTRAVGTISHDTDGHDPKKAVAMLEALNRCGIKSTWCTLFPGGYPGDFYRALQDQDFEIALHFDAMSGGEQTSWSKDNFLFQHRWLLKEAGVEHLTSNKNHYTRWEGRLDFLRWCEEAGIDSDGTRGPSKKGTIGFPLGGSQPYFPWDDEAVSPRLIKVLEVNLLTQDPVVTHPPEYGWQLAEAVRRHHGVAHFLFHPAHIQKPGVENALVALVEHGRKLEMPWWTNRQVHAWEMLRREVKAVFDSAGGVVLQASRTVPRATLLVLKTREEPRPLTLDGRSVSSTGWNLHGFDFEAVTLDLAGQAHLRGL